MISNPKKNRGFTLIELMTAIFIFTIIMTVSMGSIISIFDANRKSRSLKTVLNNLNLAVDSMSREMRFGKNYHCDTNPNASPPFTVPQNCSGPTPGRLVSFLSSEDTQITYRLNGNVIEKRIDNGRYIAITALEIVIDDLTFYTLGADAGDPLQPKVIIKITGHSGDDPSSRSDFILQTLVSQRVLDI